jgi:dihydroneopterin aldolase/2-amino-4-hydroxy-6-hydroxymethyldihydropteridine diphosphokinase
MSGSDRIELRGMRVMGVHGLLEEERERAQPFELDLTVELDLRAAGATDEIGDTIDYAALAEIAASVVGGPHVDLMERLAEMIAEAVLAWPQNALSGSHPAQPATGDGPVKAVEVTVRKLRPPVAVDIRSAGVTIRRTPSPGAVNGDET